MPTAKTQINLALPDDLSALLEQAARKLGRRRTEIAIEVLELALPLWFEIQQQQQGASAAQLTRALEVALGKTLAESLPARRRAR